jgi:diacylglycerol kinase (ATP)
MSGKKIHIILNPVAGGGKARRMASQMLREIDRRFGNRFELHVTHRPQDALRMTKEAVRGGAERIVSVGGDGTINETVNGLFENGEWICPSCELGIVSCGTGKGFARSLNLPRTLSGQLDLIRYGRCIAVDVGKVTLLNGRGEPIERLFISECQVGIGGAVVDCVESASKHLGGTLVFGFAALRTALRQRSSLVTIISDTHETTTHDLLGLAIGNGSRCGGGMRLTPQASLTDGQLDLLLILGMGIHKRLTQFPKIYSGRYLNSSCFMFGRCRHIKVVSENPLPVAADGERLGKTPCEISILPAALKVIAVHGKEDL